MPDIPLQQLLADAEAGAPLSQFRMSLVCRQQGDFAGMVRWLRRAAASGMPEAIDELGLCNEKGLGLPHDFDRAVEHYDRAIAAGSASAAYRKAELLYKSKDGGNAVAAIRDLLFRAAGGGSVLAQRVLGYLGVQRCGSREFGLGYMRLAARAGDPVSNFNLACCLLEEADSDDARASAAQHLRQAASLAYPFAAELLASLPGAGAAPPIDNAPGVPEPPADFALYPGPTSAEPDTLSEDPPVALFPDVLDTMDRAYLIFLSRPHLQRANVIDPAGDRDGQVSDVRTSMSTYLPFDIVDFIGRHIELKIVSVAGADLENSEPMSILRYGTGEYYRPHVDYFDPALTVSEALLEDGGQRTASAVTYLTAATQGGGTSFPKLGLTVPSVAGSTLLFRNCDEQGTIDRRTLHAGDTVLRGEKWVVTKWFRQEATRYLANWNPSRDR